MRLLNKKQAKKYLKTKWFLIKLRVFPQKFIKNWESLIEIANFLPNFKKSEVLQRSPQMKESPIEKGYDCYWSYPVLIRASSLNQSQYIEWYLISSFYCFLRWNIWFFLSSSFYRWWHIFCCFLNRWLRWLRRTRRSSLHNVFNLIAVYGFPFQ